MRGFVFTVRFKLAFAFGSCAFLMLLLGSASAYGLFSVGSHVRPVDRLMMTVQVAVTLGAGVAAIVFGWWIYRTVCEALDRMATRFGTVAATLDLSTRLVDIQRRRLRMDEFGQVAIEFDKLIEHVEKAMLVVHASIASGQRCNARNRFRQSGFIRSYRAAGGLSGTNGGEHGGVG